MPDGPYAESESRGRVGAVVTAAMALAVGWGATGMEIGGIAHPGAGFFPALLAVLLAALSVALWRERATLEARAPDSRNPLRVIAAAGGIALFGLLLEPAGYPVMAALAALIGLRVVGKSPWTLALPASVGAAAAIFLLFRAIGAPLPVGAWWAG